MGCREKSSFVNEYELNLQELKVYTFSLNKEWLDYVKNNRTLSEKDDYCDYDVLIGPTADDKLYDTLREYLDGTMTANEAIKVLNVLGYSNQVVLKTQKAVDAVTFIQAKELHGLEQQHFRDIIRADRQSTAIKTMELKKQFTAEREKIEKLNEVKSSLNIHPNSANYNH